MEQLTAVLDTASSKAETAALFDAWTFQMSEQLNESFGVEHVDDLEPQLMAFLDFLQGPGELNPSKREEVIHLVNVLEACKAKQTYRRLPNLRYRDLNLARGGVPNLSPPLAKFKPPPPPCLI